MSDSSPLAITAVDPELAQARACLDAYLALLTERIPGMPASHVPVPDPEADKFRGPDGVFLLAMRGDQALGCVSVKKIRPTVAEIKRLWVAPAARGQGLAGALMQAAEDFCRDAGYAEIWLDTNAALTEAVAYYQSRGWREIPAYTDWPATHWFGKTL